MLESMGPQRKSFWTFWTTLPGVLTGIAGLLGAITALIIALRPPVLPIHHEESTIPANWPLIALETFAKEKSAWMVGSFLEEPAVPRFHLSVADGVYRWEIESQSDTASGRFVISPYPSARNFMVAVDVRVTDLTPLLTSTTSLVFGSDRDEQYIFSVSSSRYFTLYLDDITNKYMTRAIDWTPIGVRFVPNIWNRLSVVVDEGLVNCYLNAQYLGSYKYNGFIGGKVGLSVQLDHKGSATFEFDNFEFRRKP
jgi:hypothetical protein